MGQCLVKYVWSKDLSLRIFNKIELIWWIPNFENKYAATTDGYIATFIVSGRGYHYEDPTWLNFYKSCGYFLVKLGHYGLYSVSRLIASTFFGLNLNSSKIEVDHKDRNRLNNFIDNLRLCNHVQNQANSKQKGRYSSLFKGVSWNKDHRKWQSRIQFNKKQIHLGYFNSEIEATKIYDISALKYFGEFALTNKILGLY